MIEVYHSRVYKIVKTLKITFSFIDIRHTYELLNDIVYLFHMRLKSFESINFYLIFLDAYN